ncbi:MULTISPECIES: polysaccharide biosynthesis protein [Flavobacteriaceae]|uniref:Polysaccharide biosynthesis protein n=2 Tax=Flavobacteriaceae TaxID=49546 RepID=A0A4Y8ASW3_9FLAO|nr:MULTISPECIES: nucleoside-diphosphate sugar epimerase/dehydratase [Flavobacteriaceae]TEW74967.1 polysaccharide biosynthesis protein [Gramella jeungdoensis]GGK42694.1 polysaccharide biosynthesis protein CapD [Lutibacter litoralis]
MISNVFRELLKRNTPRWFVLIIDIYIVFNTFILSYLIRFNFSLNFDTSKFIIQLPVVVIAALISFLMVGSYKGVIRHTGVRDSINVILASFLIFGTLIAIVMLNHQFNFITEFTIPKSIIAIHFLLNVIVLIVIRFLYKEFYSLLTSGSSVEKRVLIYGAGEAGILVHSILKDDKTSRIHLVGFVDDDKRKAGNKLNGIRIYNSDKINIHFVEKKSIDEVILAIQNIKPSKLIEIVDTLSKLPIEVKIVPPVQTWMNGDLQAKQIKPVKIEDLLGRVPIELNNPMLHKEYSDKVIIVTGAAGSIGSEIVRQVASFKVKHLVLIDQAESDLYNLQQYFSNKNIQNIIAIVADVQNKNRIATIFKKYKPQIVFHAAAYKHVPLMEENPYEAVRTNVMGSKNLADLSVEYNVEKFVMISTDKAVNPTNVMGTTKRIAEMYINCLNAVGTTKFITTRFGNVLGSNGSVIPLFQSQIKSGGPITVTHKDVTRYFMTIPEACQLVLEAGSMGNGGEIFVFDMGKSIKIYDLAINMIRLSGLKYPDDIAIEIKGLRPGEKIYEELLATTENTIETHHEKIMIAKVTPLDAETVKEHIKNLCDINNKDNNELTVLKMKQIVPEFISNNSKYQVLDK